jgi:hypothetical protein
MLRTLQFFKYLSNLNNNVTLLLVGASCFLEGKKLDFLGSDFCALVGAITGSRRVNLVLIDKIEETATISATTIGEPQTFPLRNTHQIFHNSSSVVFVPTMDELPFCPEHPLAKCVPNAKSLVGCQLQEDERTCWLVMAWNPGADFFKNDDRIAVIERLFYLVQKSGLSQAKSEIDFSTAMKSQGFSESFPAEVLAIHSEPVSKFLFETLIVKKRLLTRNGVNYLALRQWRKPIKPYQVDALKALKADKDPSCVQAMADEIVDQVLKVYGNLFTDVVPVPGGNSGRERSLSVMIAEAVAKKLNLPLRNVLVAAPVPLGASHPKKSANLKPYGLREEVTGNVLIIDDVSTSGKHVELATNALKPFCKYSTAVVWVAD